MTDTAQNIKQLQLKIWLDKTPSQRLRQFLQNNEDLLNFWAKIKSQQTVSANEKKNAGSL